MSWSLLIGSTSLFKIWVPMMTFLTFRDLLWFCCHIWKRWGNKRWFRIGPHTVFDCGNDWRDCTGLIPPFVEPLCVKSQHWWNCFCRVEILLLPLWCSTVNKLTVLGIMLFLTAPFRKDIFWDISSSSCFPCINLLNHVCCSVNPLFNKKYFKTKRETLLCDKWHF